MGEESEGKSILESILNFIYPPVCGICGKIDEKFLCKKCENRLKANTVFKIDNYNDDILKFYNEHMYIFIYDGIIRKTIINYKFNEKSYIYKTLSNYILKNKKFIEKIQSYDIIIPVPISKERYKQRGYNQSELIVEEIGRKVQTKIERKVLYKIKNIVPQSTLNKEEREQNIKGAYKIKNIENIINKKILLFDDIYTTGSTVNECCKILTEKGVKELGILTLAKD